MAACTSGVSACACLYSLAALKLATSERSASCTSTAHVPVGVAASLRYMALTPSPRAAFSSCSPKASVPMQPRKPVADFSVCSIHCATRMLFCVAPPAMYSTL